MENKFKILVNCKIGKLNDKALLQETNTSSERSESRILKTR